MKKILFLLSILTVGMATSCVDDDKDMYNPESKQKHLERFVLTEKVNIPASDAGQITIVKLDGETVYEGNMGGTIEIPKFSTVTRSINELEYFYEVYTGTGYYGNIRRKGLLMFEDWPTGDNDYNDFICEILNEEIGVGGDPSRISYITGANIRILPIALGSVKPLKFGMEIRNLITGEIIFEKVLVENVRSYFFGEKAEAEDFINTTNDDSWGIYKKPVVLVGEKPFHFYHTANLPASTPIGVNWYIVSDGVKRYSASAGTFLGKGVIEEQILTYDNVPFGLFLPNRTWKDFDWTQETHSIFKAYPDFNKLVESGFNGDPFERKIWDANYFFDKTKL